MKNANKTYILVICVFGIVTLYYATANYDNMYKFKQDQEKTTKKEDQEKITKKQDRENITKEQDQEKITKIDSELLCANYNISKRPSDFNQTAILEALLDNPNGIIDKYFSKEIIRDPYATHAIPLIIAALLTKGDILELGVGLGSTPILNKIAKEQNRLVVSIEMNNDWLQKYAHFNDSFNHLLFYEKSICANTISSEKEWGLVFVDHLSGGTRHIDMIKYAGKAQILIAHDSEKHRDDGYLYSLAYPYFKYHCKYTLHVSNSDYISTSLLSNSYKFEQIEKILNKTYTDLPHVVCDQNYK